MPTESPPRPSDHQLAELRIIETKINALLPPRYQGCFEDVPPSSMGSAKLKTGPDGQIAWDEIWTTFCHLALAGGPPHRGTLLAPVPMEEAIGHPEEQRLVLAEIQRAIGMTTELSTFLGPTPGWVGVRCQSPTRPRGWCVPSSPKTSSRAATAMRSFCPPGRFRLDKEIKNVVTCLAKTCHYLLDHLPPGCRPDGLERRLVEPATQEEIAASPAGYQSAIGELERGVRQVTRLDTATDQPQGWIGVRCASEEMSVWMLRAVAVEDVLVRREDDLLCIPVSMHGDRRQGIDRVLTVVAQAHRLWCVRAVQAGAPRR